MHHHAQLNLFSLIVSDTCFIDEKLANVGTNGWDKRIEVLWLQDSVTCLHNSVALSFSTLVTMDTAPSPHTGPLSFPCAYHSGLRSMPALFS
jgi:hypothetical protein